MSTDLSREGRENQESDTLKPREAREAGDNISRAYHQEKRLETARPFEEIERQRLKDPQGQSEKDALRGREMPDGRDYQQGKRIEGARPFDQLERERQEPRRQKKSEIIEDMVTRDHPVSPERRADNTRDFHYIDERRFEAELKERDPSATEKDERLTEGFHDGRDHQAFVKEKGDTLLTSVHEKLHQKSMSELPTRFNEGLTEHFARNESGGAGRLKDIDHRGREIPRPLSDYEREVEVVGKLEASIGREPLERAYFDGDSAYLRDNVDSALGDGAFQRITDSLEKRDYDAASEIIEKYYRR